MTVDVARPDVARADVAIVGCGPVGALLGNLLGAAGLAVEILDRDRDIHPLPRAVHFDGEVMRIFQAAGLADRLAATARPSSKGMEFVNAAGRTLMVRRGIEGPGPHGWAGNWYFHQPLLEAVLIFTWRDATSTANCSSNWMSRKMPTSQMAPMTRITGQTTSANSMAAAPRCRRRAFSVLPFAMMRIPCRGPFWA